ncbi:hypothetical protein D039_1940A, partial [Vibrio parahaemolyticus EKP-028]
MKSPFKKPLRRIAAG